MGVYSEYLDKQNLGILLGDDLDFERKKELKRISEIRKRPVVVYASDMSKDNNAPISIDYSDIVPFADQLSMIEGEEVDIILETPGGISEIVEDLVNHIRSRFNKVGIIVPGMSKSAGTIFTMAADEILMGELSTLGPIDVQIFMNGKHYSADAFLEGLNKIIDESNKKQQLDLAYIPLLQSISPGEIQHCKNGQDFSKKLVTDWLVDYKFKFWEKHNSTGKEVTLEEKKERALEIATKLCNHNHWLTHGRSIRINDLQEMGLQITDYSKHTELNDAINRYFTLLRMTFERSNVYKVYETPTSQVYRSTIPQPQIPIPPQSPNNTPNPILANVKCIKCNADLVLQINLGQEMPLQEGAIPFPKNNILRCPVCKHESSIKELRQQIEIQFNKIVV
ncbi:hypothetical protein MmiHf6_12820 [Methanimicrococcus hongohii]|uniref:Clp protease ClpP n=1 Tax=Methanimicrococcus hongohii TaxID=3028295 RepID=A0AA96V2L6_9EURY|nr:hypothetical protein [Methanimicrococcus sp. Hf6]WNY23958.1 hypothetical protein MmiHf6_12820 [Methanimicrococcus sp. Hf6]